MTPFYMIFYYNTPHTPWVMKLGLVVVSVKFRRVVMSPCRIYPLVGHIHEQ